MTAIAYPEAFLLARQSSGTRSSAPDCLRRAFLAVDGVPRARSPLDHGRDGGRPLPRDGLNRLIDAGLDARNPRTARRELPAGLLSKAQVVLFCLGSFAVFLVAVYQLDPLVHWLWPIPVVGFVVYPYLKRWTWLCHLWLGAVDGLAPLGAWRRSPGTCPGRLGPRRRGRAWVAGFDLFSRCSISRSTAPRAYSRSRSASASEASSWALGSFTSAPWHCW
jgi:4-hydroxybenzoate polyprenyltransferase